MTGFGRGEATCNGYAITVEIATVNRKQFDASIWLPREWMCFEVKVLGLLKASIARGAVKCAINIKSTAMADAAGALSARYQQVCALAESLKISCSPTLSDLVSLATADLADAAVPEPTDELWGALEMALGQALKQLQAMREHEGARIAQDIEERLRRLYAMYTDIAATAPTLPALYRDQLAKRINDLLPSGITLDEGLLEREVALFADRCDISEELTRLEAHFAHAKTLLAGDAPCGRPLDFLCQEFFREINTTGSKCASNHISTLTIEFKTLLETVREQVQNLE
jgi:uncharacterized protein (TIGR00255 family)